MALKVGINGFGRIGRNIYRAAWDLKPDFEIVAVNDIGDAKTFAHLLKHDTALGTFAPAVKAEGDAIHVDGHTVRFMTQKEPTELPWKDLGVDVVIESTGLFTKHEDLKKHITAGAKKVVLSAPEKDDTEHDTFVIGVNEDKLSAEHQIFSNASCTTNCITPVMAILEEAIGIEK